MHHSLNIGGSCPPVRRGIPELFQAFYARCVGVSPTRQEDRPRVTGCSRPKTEVPFGRAMGKQQPGLPRYLVDAASLGAAPSPV